MSCQFCTYPIAEGDSTAETPCCDLIVHTTCIISTIASNTIHYHDSLCICGGILHALSHNNGIDYEAEQAINRIKIEELIKQPTAKKEFSVLKKAHIDQRKAVNAFSSKLKDAVKTYKEQIGASLNMIKTIKAETVALIKASPEFKNLRKLNSRVSFFLSRFKRKYNLNDREISFFCRGSGRRRWRYWQAQPAGMIRYKFRIRI
jgi:hypothetical protein